MTGSAAEWGARALWRCDFRPFRETARGDVDARGIDPFSAIKASRRAKQSKRAHLDARRSSNSRQSVKRRNNTIPSVSHFFPAESPSPLVYLKSSHCFELEISHTPALSTALSADRRRLMLAISNFWQPARVLLRAFRTMQCNIMKAKGTVKHLMLARSFESAAFYALVRLKLAAAAPYRASRLVYY